MIWWFRIMSVIWLIILVDSDPTLAMYVAVLLGVVNGVIGLWQGIADVKGWESKIGKE